MTIEKVKRPQRLTPIKDDILRLNSRDASFWRPALTEYTRQSTLHYAEKLGVKLTSKKEKYKGRHGFRFWLHDDEIFKRVLKNELDD